MLLNSSKKFYPRTNLRSLLVLPFVFQLLIILGMINFVSYRNTQKALRDVTDRFQKEITLRIENHLIDYLNMGNHLNKVNETGIIFNQSLLDDAQELARFFLHQYRWNPSINIIAFAREKDGSYVEVIRESSGNFILRILDTNNSNTLSTYSVNSEGKIMEILAQEKNTNFDPRKSLWYQDTITSNQKQWHNVYQTKITKDYVLSSSLAIYDDSDNLIGVLTNNTSLASLSVFMNELKVGKTGIAFIINEQNLLIADSIIVGGGSIREEEKFLLTSALQNDNVYLREINKFLLEKFKKISNIKNPVFIETTINDNNVFLDVINLRNEQGINWFIILMIPESDFLAFIRDNNLLSFILSIIAIALAIISGLISSKFIIQPIIKLKNASVKISEGDFTQKIPYQGIQELDTLADSFNNMTEMLEAIFNNLNKSLQDVSNFKYAIDQSAIVTITDPEGVIIYCNEKLVEISGYDYDDLLGKKTNKFKSNYHSKKFYQTMWQQISQGNVWRGEIKNLKKNQKYYWVDTTIVPFKDEKGEIIQYLSIQSEITERKKLEKNLEQLVEIRTKELAEANEEITILNKRLCSENIQLTDKLKILHEMQQLILPKKEELMNIKNLDIAGYSEPTDELGGDYYDVLINGETITFGIGDVTGHGLESGILMVMTQAAICTLKQLGETNPVDFLDIINRAIFYNVQRMRSDKNLSLSILNYYRGKICISGQHEEVIIIRENGEVELIDTIDLGLPIGIDADIREFISYQFISLNQGDGIALYTDGITEARNKEKQQYGIERLCRVIKENWEQDSETIIKIVIEDVKKFIGLQKIEDDLTLVVLKQK